MSELHRIKCDRCGEAAGMKKPTIPPAHVYSWKAPNGWSNVKEEDLCKKCTKEFQKHCRSWK